MEKGMHSLGLTNIDNSRVYRPAMIAWSNDKQRLRPPDILPIVPIECVRASLSQPLQMRVSLLRNNCLLWHGCAWFTTWRGTCVLKQTVTDRIYVETLDQNLLISVENILGIANPLDLSTWLCPSPICRPQWEKTRKWHPDNHVALPVPKLKYYR